MRRRARTRPSGSSAPAGPRPRAPPPPPTLFGGGGWYPDAEVADACAELGYVDCTPRVARPPYLPPGSPWATLSEPSRVRLPSGGLLLAIPTTHSLGDVARAFVRRATLPSVVHAYF